VNEAEWLACTDPGQMLEHLRGTASLRKFRLFACGCCRLAWELLGPEARVAVEVTERFIEGRASKEEVNVARAAAHRVAVRDVDQWYGPPFGSDVDTVAHWHPAVAVAVPRASAPYRFAWMAFYAADLAERASRRETQVGAASTRIGGGAAQTREQAALVRCVFGNPFCPGTIDRAWLSRTVVALARQMYESRDFTAMPILADALQDAGCDNADILDHCRGPGPHVRGCWVVDLVLGKS